MQSKFGQHLKGGTTSPRGQATDSHNSRTSENISRKLFGTRFQRFSGVTTMSGMMMAAWALFLFDEFSLVKMP
jgi:hypothetical protein